MSSYTHVAVDMLCLKGIGRHYMPYVHAHATPNTISMYVNGQHECLSLQHSKQCAPVELWGAGELLPAQLPFRRADLCASASCH